VENKKNEPYKVKNNIDNNAIILIKPIKLYEKQPKLQLIMKKVYDKNQVCILFYFINIPTISLCNFVALKLVEFKCLNFLKIYLHKQ
jgi:hypothetical protein